MKVCMYFQVHQPHRVRRYQIFDIGQNDHYFDEDKNKEVMEKVARKCYIPTNKLLLKLIKQYKGKFKVAFSITGSALEQMEKYAPEALDLFKQLADTGCVEFLSETYNHSLSYIYSKEEFKQQVQIHSQRMKELFHQEPKVFRNTELIFNNELANFVEQLGFKAILAEGADHILGWRSPNYIYKAKTTNNMKLLLKNYKLSDDIAFRFSDSSWKEHPLSIEKFAKWIEDASGDTINLFMDYETFGEHQWEETGIFKFMELLPGTLIEKGIEFVNPSDFLHWEPKEEIDMHSFVSWADIERDLSAWVGNSMQSAAIKELYNMESAVKKSGDEKLLQNWRKLTTSDHFYYMCTKWFNDGDVHKYFNPYDTPYEAFIAYMNILNDMSYRLKGVEESDQSLNVIDENPSSRLIIDNVKT